MRSFQYIKSFLLIMLCAGILTTSAVYTDKAIANPLPAQQSTAQQIEVSPLAVVNNPKSYLNKSVLMKAKFDKFSALGLDYKPAFRSSEDYISFLIQREDTVHDIPLSEMKLFLKRSIAEKMTNVKTNDEIKIQGLVFSDALGDAWIDVSDITIIKKAPEDKNNGVK